MKWFIHYLKVRELILRKADKAPKEKGSRALEDEKDINIFFFYIALS